MGSLERVDGPGPSLAAFAPLRAVLVDQLEAMAGRLTALLLAQIPEADRELPHGETAELEAACWRCLRDTIEVLVVYADGSGPVPTHRAREAGRRRARQGVPLAWVLRAYQVGARVLWEAICREARDSPEVVVDEAGLLDLAGVVWQLIDEQSASMVDAYRLEESRLLAHASRERGAVLDALVDGRGHEPTVAQDAARTLGVDADEVAEHSLVVIVAPVDAPGSDPLREVQASLLARGIAAAWHMRSGVDFGLIALEGRDLGGVLDLVEADVDGRVGASTVIHRFADVPCAFRLAETVARTLPPGSVGLARLADRLPETLLAGSPDVTALLLGEAFARLLDLPDRDRRPLLRTLEAVLEHDGSATHAAGDLYCHRNTVIYRMRRIAALTGRDPSRPRDKLMLMLAVMAARQRGLLDVPRGGRRGQHTRRDQTKPG